MQADKSYPHLDHVTHLLSFAILLVEIGHSRIANDSAANPELYWFIWKVIYSFHMHLFMFISGFLFMHTNINKNHFNYIQFIIKKFKRLLIPYFSLMSVAFLIRLILSDYVSKKLQLSNFFIMFINPRFAAIDYYWFIFVLFSVFVFAPVLYLSVKHNNRIAMSLMTLGLIYLNLNPIQLNYFYLYRASTFFLYFWLGCVFFVFRERLDPLLGNYSSALLFFAALIGLNLIPGFIFVAIFRALAGILFSYALIQIYTRNKLNLFKWIEGHYYQIFLLSWFFHKSVEFLLYRLGDLGFYVVFPTSFLCSLFFSINIAKLIRKRFAILRPVVGL